MFDCPLSTSLLLVSKKEKKENTIDAHEQHWHMGSLSGWAYLQSITQEK